MTDAAFMLAVLERRPNQWVSQKELYDASLAERGHGATWHSRASDLRKLGHTIENQVVRKWDNYHQKFTGRAESYYRLIVPEAEEKLKERLLSKVERAENGCWQWTGHVKGSYGGYPGIQVGNRDLSAHRVAYELFVGPIPDGLQLDHLCRNKHCVNPEHLEPVTASVNKQRDYDASEFCRAGLHRKSPDNYDYNSSNGRRQCKQCRQERRAARRAAALEAAADPSVTGLGDGGSAAASSVKSAGTEPNGRVTSPSTSAPVASVSPDASVPAEKTGPAEGGDALAQRRGVTGCGQVAESAEAETDSGFMAGGRRVVGGASTSSQASLFDLPKEPAWH